MVLVSSLSSRFNKNVASFLLRHGLSARFRLGGGVIRDSPTLDAISMVPFAQTLISIEAQDDAVQAAKQASLAPKEPSALDKFVDFLWDRWFEHRFPDPNKSSGDNVKIDSPSVPDITSNNPRMLALEQYLRPALSPNNKWSDVTRWQFNHRFIKWARSEFLIAKYGHDVRDALEAYPELRIAPLKRKGKAGASMLSFLHQSSSKDSDGDRLGSSTRRLPLPSMEMLVEAFHMQNWNRRKNVSAEYRHMEQITQKLGGSLLKIPGSTLYFPDIPPDADISILALEEILEVTGAHVIGCGPFNVLCEEGNIYEFWTKDYVMKLSKYLLKRCEAFGGEVTILDVGAGDGTLAHFLREFMTLEMRQREQQYRKRQKPGDRKRRFDHLPTVVATDDGSWNIKPEADVEKLNVVESMKKYGPLQLDDGKIKTSKSTKQHLIVICSWMPMGEDWSADMRSAGADEYILIGQCDDGNCGDNYTTWGNPDFFVDQDSSKDGGGTSAKTQEPPYSCDGFERIDLEELSSLQFSRFDSSESSSSRTVSFRRK